MRYRTEVVPAGLYYLGDPCYSFDNGKKPSTWLHILDNSRDLEEVYKDGNNLVLALGTAHGDGRYEDNFGNEYPVDAGVIGLVSVGLNEVNELRGRILVEFTEPTVCKREEGVLTFGEYVIDTDPQTVEEEWEEDYYPDDEEEEDEE